MPNPAPSRPGMTWHLKMLQVADLKTASLPGALKGSEEHAHELGREHRHPYPEQCWQCFILNLRVLFTWEIHSPHAGKPKGFQKTVEQEASLCIEVETSVTSFCGRDESPSEFTPQWCHATLPGSQPLACWWPRPGEAAWRPRPQLLPKGLLLQGRVRVLSWQIAKLCRAGL